MLTPFIILKVKNVEIAMDRKVNLPRGYAYVEFEQHDAAEKARLHLDGVSDRLHSRFRFPPQTSKRAIRNRLRVYP